MCVYVRVYLPNHRYISISQHPFPHTPNTTQHSVEGPGAGACEPVAPSCPSSDRTTTTSSSGYEPPAFPIPASVPLLGHDHEEVESGVGEEMKEHFLLLGDLSVPSMESSTESPTEATKGWERRLRRAMRGAVPGMDEGQEALQVSVWAAGLDPFFFPADGGGEEAGKFKVRVLVGVCVYVCFGAR